MNRTNEQIADGWIALSIARKAHGDNFRGDPNFWAFEELSRLSAADPERTIDIILATMDRMQRRRGGGPLKLADEDNFMAFLAAGPLEDLLAYHGATVISRIEKLAKSDERMLELVGGVWPREEIQAEVWKRVEALRRRP